MYGSQIINNFVESLHKLYWWLRFCLRPQQGLSKPSFSSPIRYFTPGQASRVQTLYITNASSLAEPRHFLIYHYITGHLWLTRSNNYYTQTSNFEYAG